MGLSMNCEGGRYIREVAGAQRELKRHRIVERIWARDYTVWKENPQEIVNRLGWLTAPSWTLQHLPEIEAFVDSVISDGFERVLLLGMGGSSLAAQVISQIYKGRAGYLPLSVLDTTDPALILREREAIERSKTLVIVSSKSGTTVETDALMKYFYRALVSRWGAKEAGRWMVAITDPDSNLAKIGEAFGFRHVFLNDPEIGGRFSALSLVGMVPSALMGLNCREFLAAADSFAAQERERGSKALSARLGVFLGELARLGPDKLEIFISPHLSELGAWLEQLIAESTGKEGKGMLPIVEEAILPAEYYGSDRVFVHLRKSDEKTVYLVDWPYVDLKFTDLADLSSLFFLWELAIAIAGWRLGINPFDQPDVERAKKAAREALHGGREERPDFTVDGMEIYGAKGFSRISQLLDDIITRQDTSYLAILAYLTPSPEILEALRALRAAFVQRYRKAVTVGFGPRYLHSTGQLHKGDAGKGVFIYLTEPVHTDVPIPESMAEDRSSLTFGALRAAQWAGDCQALTQGGRRVIRINFRDSTAERLTALGQMM
ncbi:MAG TPA: hypothetical protein PLT64_02405 [Syntrophales bacterium]|nr:hypothetical protein [Syntrophales bacterium]HOL58703.1 hypothetical protein [Syntrophales bacterium]HPO35009.1 hypothetical protein [Syntrophales bacterium]